MSKELRFLKGIIYCIYNKENHLSYIGKAEGSFYGRYSGGKWWEKTKNTLLKNDYQRYGVDAFSVSILEHSLGPVLLATREKEIIKERNTLHPNGYNQVDPSGDILVFSEEVRRRMSQKAKAWSDTHENNFKGKTHTAEVRERLRDANLGRKMMPHVRAILDKHKKYGKDNPLVKGRSDPETFKKWEEARKAKIFKRPVLQIHAITGETLHEFADPRAAANSVNLKPNTIRNVCNGDCKTAGGYVWKYKHSRVLKARKPNKNRKKVCQIDAETGLIIKIFDSLHEASKALGTTSGNISKACRGKLGKIRGFLWRYSDEAT